MARLAYVDMIRGFAVAYMLVFQLLDMFSSELSCYGNYYFAIKWFNWFSIFMVIAGYSLKLMHDKYDTRAFYWKVFKRFVQFSLLGFFLTLWCEFPINFPLIFDSEILLAIGLNLLWLSLWFLVPIKNKYVNACWFFGWSLVMVVLNQLFHVDTSFNIFWVLGFMLFGVALAYLEEKSSFLIVGLLLFTSADYYQRNFEFWLLNCSIITVMLILSKYLQNIELILSYYAFNIFERVN